MELCRFCLVGRWSAVPEDAEGPDGGDTQRAHVHAEPPTGDQDHLGLRHAEEAELRGPGDHRQRAYAALVLRT